MSKKQFKYDTESVFSKQLTHNLLKEAVEVIASNEEDMVLILHSEEDKPEFVWHNALNGAEYETSTNKADYIKQRTGFERDTILLPITKVVLDKVSDNIGSKAVAKVEKELYGIVVNAN